MVTRNREKEQIIIRFGGLLFCQWVGLSFSHIHCLLGVCHITSRSGNQSGIWQVCKCHLRARLEEEGLERGGRKGNLLSLSDVIVSDMLLVWCKEASQDSELVP